MRRIFGMSLLVAAFMPAACSHKDYSYNLNENGCETHEQVFSSQEDYCRGLKNEQLNGGCAVDLRRQNYQRDCGNDFDAPGA